MPVMVRGHADPDHRAPGTTSPRPSALSRTRSSVSNTCPTTTGSPIPRHKLDHIAIPDFAAGAMENVGLITYRDAYLVLDEAKASQSELQSLSRRDWPRNRPPVVRQPGHHEVVGGRLAERGIRQLHGAQGDRCQDTGLEALAGLRQSRSPLGNGHRSARHDPADRVRGQLTCRGRRDVRRDHVWQGLAPSCG